MEMDVRLVHTFDKSRICTEAKVPKPKARADPQLIVC